MAVLPVVKITGEYAEYFETLQADLQLKSGGLVWQSAAACLMLFCIYDQKNWLISCSSSVMMMAP